MVVKSTIFVLGLTAIKYALHKNDRRSISNLLDSQITCISAGLADVHDIITADISIHALQL